MCTKLLYRKMVVLRAQEYLSTTNTVTRGALFTERCLLHAFLQKSGRLFFVQLYYGVLNEQGEMSMNPLPWLADPAFYAETSPVQDGLYIAVFFLGLSGTASKPYRSKYRTAFSVILLAVIAEERKVLYGE